MSLLHSLDTIIRVSKIKMPESECDRYVSEVILFCMNRLHERNSLSPENLAAALKQEAEFHLLCESKDAA
jgi:hypothetical protein